MPVVARAAKVAIITENAGVTQTHIFQVQDHNMVK